LLSWWKNYQKRKIRRIIPDYEPDTEVTNDCKSSKFGCCANGVKSKTDKLGSNCKNVDPEPVEPVETDCIDTVYGCCPNGIDAKTTDEGKNCPSFTRDNEPECASTTYGCCPDGKTIAEDVKCSNKKVTTKKCICDEVTDCTDTAFGCCADKVTAKETKLGENCPSYE